MPLIQCNGADLYYEDHGEGQPIVFLHGATAGLRYFEPQLMGLSNEYRTIAVDFRGHGRSEKSELGHTLGQYTRDVQTVLEELDLDRIVLVGWSMGALISWEYIHQFGTDRLRAIVDIDMEPSPVKRGDYEYGTYGTEDLEGAIDAIQQDPIGLLDEEAEALLKDPPTRELRNLILDEGSRTPPPIQGALLFGLSFIRDYRELLRSVDIPALVCAGADEKWRSVASVKYAAELIPDARFELFEGSGHCITVEEPDRFNRVLSDFIESL
ncbi:alpha/beta hydrolase [Halogeometricum pallidum JCM 14848]|uniref:Alpha/beta hydrolase n=1 Tax=Halogeometricum pallidum JCM 14848 TaxID=1227487 RepID=M0DAF8_HALPD|nr:alpha/beta hydrolase [Halogeometricum pallidum]ELZ32436.1 alpha/beta hydrolase [Halogeometricum pallidum JCM 14848]